MVRQRTTPLGQSAHVECGSCSLCCWNAAIILVDGDEDWYEKEQCGTRTDDGRPVYMLKRKPNGACVYLDDAGKCTIHGRAPLICRQFSCVEAFQFYTAQERRQLVKDKLIDKRVWAAARERLGMGPKAYKGSA